MLFTRFIAEKVLGKASGDLWSRFCMLVSCSIRQLVKLFEFEDVLFKEFFEVCFAVAYMAPSANTARLFITLTARCTWKDSIARFASEPLRAETSRVPQQVRFQYEPAAQIAIRIPERIAH